MTVRTLPALLRPAVLALVLAAPLPAVAQATPEEAARLQAIGETYFGKPPAGEPPFVTVVPEADHYRASLDLGTMVRLLMAAAATRDEKVVTFDWAPISVALAPQADGRWRVWDHRFPKLSVTQDGQTTDATVEGIAIDMIVDPATGAVAPWTGRIGRIVSTSTVAKPGEDVRVTSTGTSDGLALSGESKPATTPGALDATVRQTVATTAYTLDITGGAKTGVPDMKFALGIAGQDQTVGLAGLRWQPILDLWAHLVAHHEPADVTTGQSALKAKIAAALPLFETLREKATTGEVSFESAFGVMKIGKVGFDVDTAGVVRDGHFGLAIGLADLKAYSLFMPKWAQKLVPTDLALAGHVSGYDLATPISVFLDEADFAAKPPLTPEKQQKIAALFLPHGGVDVVLDGNRFVAPLYDVALDGRLTAGPTGAKGAVTVRAKGLDKVADHLASPEAKDEQARMLAGIVAMARGFAERKGDDFVWRFDFDGDKVAVNGKPLK